MNGLLVLVHTVPPLLAVFDRLVAEKLPGVRVKHILDEPLLEAVRQRGGLTGSDGAPDTGARLRAHVDLAAAIGARSVLVTCSTISPLVDQVRPGARLPVYKIDEAMLDAAVQLGPRIGVLATNPATLGPTENLLLERARSAGCTVEVQKQLVPGAFDAILAGDGATHDRLLSAAIIDIAARVDAVVLAQATMARVLDVLPAEARTRPVLSSPHLALERLQEVFE